LSDRFGRRPVMLMAVALFTAASLGCMLAQDVTVLLVCRVLQPPLWPVRWFPARRYGINTRPLNRRPGWA
jgi:MFS family permease